MSTVRRLSAFAGVPARRVALAILLGALATCFGIGLMTSAGYLISRAAEQPPILSLTVTIVAVRFFGLARPLARYLERITSHDVALRSLARIRTRFYERIEPLAPAQLEGYRRGELLNRMVGDVDALQGLYPRGVGPPLVAIAAPARRSSPRRRCCRLQRRSWRPASSPAASPCRSSPGPPAAQPGAGRPPRAAS
jgi:ABC-type transport system involved in cytochrome bd biosynthesis fused ATPase/permease subunit